MGRRSGSSEKSFLKDPGTEDLPKTGWTRKTLSPAPTPGLVPRNNSTAAVCNLWRDSTVTLASEMAEWRGKQGH